ncbi:hypothetical protein Zmor_000338 [Zophobas morio]|uniref:Uncharacterized protein n=1 Tax=Zophobas morio TaxID=2755281 RepID=A0AA38IZ05_9CUCU|nr:hypothetical protein Zmor_000338 [Zophobas morio]
MKSLAVLQQGNGSHGDAAARLLWGCSVWGRSSWGWLCNGVVLSTVAAPPTIPILIKHNETEPFYIDVSIKARSGERLSELFDLASLSLVKKARRAVMRVSGPGEGVPHVYE